MFELKKTGKVFTSKSVGTGPSSYKKEIAGPRSHKGWETLLYMFQAGSPLEFQLTHANGSSKQGWHIPDAVYSFRASDDGRRNRPKHVEQCFPTFSTSRYPWPGSSYLTVPLEKTSIFFKLIYFLIISYLRDITIYCCWVSVYSLINYVKMNVI